MVALRPIDTALSGRRRRRLERLFALCRNAARPARWSLTASAERGKRAIRSYVAGRRRATRKRLILA
jgi:hypothetical protein